MIKQLLILLLCLPISLFSQQAFYDTWKIINQEDLLLREDVNELIDIYTQKTTFNVEHKSQIESLINFVNNPFQEDFRYEYIFTESCVLLKDLIKSNLSKKENINERDYELILACDSLLPATYKAFIADDKIILDNELQACFDVGHLAKYPSNHEVIVERKAVIMPSTSMSASEEMTSPPVSIIPRPPIASFPTRMIDATSQFLVERVKEELLLAFFDRFYDHIDNSVELTSLMPNTYFLLKNNDIFKVPSMGEVWVTAFEEDLDSVLDNLENMVTTNPKYAPLKSSPNLQYFLMAGFIYQQIQNKDKESNLSQKLNYFYDNFSDTDLQAVKMLGVINLLSNNLKKTNSSSDWISISDFRNLFKREKNAALYFTALLFHQDRELFNGIQINTEDKVVNLGHQMKTNVKLFTKKAGKFLSAIDQFKISNEAFKNTNHNDSISLPAQSDAKLGYALAIFDLLDYGIELAYFNHPESLATSSYHTTYRPLAIKTIQTYDAILRKDHGEMMLYSMQLLEPLVQVRIDHLENKLLRSLNNTSTKKELKNKKLQKEIKVLKGVVQNYSYYGGFMIDILSAKSPRQIKDIIYKYAEPAGSFRVKRQSTFSVSLSSHPGLYGGLETINNTNTSFVTGVTAPIGLSLNWGKKKFALMKKEHSLSLYFPIIDIGAAFSYRWKNSNGEGFPEEIKWEQVLSPGIHGVWGIGNSPMALMVGAQYTPLLRNITNRNNELQSNAWRIGATITVDIPIMHFYQSSGRR